MTAVDHYDSCITRRDKAVYRRLGAKGSYLPL